MSFYKRNLPHWQPEGAEYFITFRLAGSLPKEAVAKIKNERNRLWRERKETTRSSGSLPEQQKPKNNESAGSDRLSDLRDEIQRKTFKKYEILLDKAEKGPIWLEKSAVADVVKEAIHYRDEKEYDLYAYTIMPNHVHLVFKLLRINGHGDTDNPVTEILKSLKWYTALKTNRILNRTGAFWQDESYDRVIRDARELENTIAYTLNNPVKAGLVKKWEDWAYSYCEPEFLPTFLNET